MNTMSLYHHEEEWVDCVDPGVRPLLHAEVVQGQVRVGEVDVVGAGAEHGGQDGHHRDHPDEEDDGADSGNLQW